MRAGTLLTVRRLTTREDLLGALPDPLLEQLTNRWASGEPAYTHSGAVFLHHLWGDGPEPVVVGDPESAAALARAHADGRAVSVPRAAGALLVAEDGWTEHEGWAYRLATVPPRLPVTGAEWVAGEDEVREVLEKGFPDASMPVGHPDVRRWAGIRRNGALVAVAADATGRDGLGFLASIATHPDARGTGAGTAVTAFATVALIEAEGRCGLWHMGHNAVAAALYTRLGYSDDHQMTVVSPR